MATARQRLVLDLLNDNPEGVAGEAANRFCQMSEVHKCDVMLIAGTGWDLALRELGTMKKIISVSELPGFLLPVADGHAGTLSVIQIGKQQVVVSSGRTHAYEFKGGWFEAMPAILHRVHVAHALGCDTMIHTSAVGGLQAWTSVGDLVLVRDLNDIITGIPSPLLGGANFLTVTRVYDSELLELCKTVDPNLHDATLTTILGPHFETHAVAEYLTSNGIGIVGMSGIPEAILAHSLRMRNLAMGLVTDAAGSPVTHEEVQRIVRERGPQLGRFLREVIERM